MNIVLVGAGLASANAIAGLRDRGHDGEITLIGAETHLPYERPPLSKGVLLDDSPVEDAFVHERAWYDDNGVRLVLGQPATALNLAHRRVRVGDESFDYDKLLLATGAHSRHLAQFDDADIEVAYLRTMDESLALHDHLKGQLLIIGAGWIGLEVAAAARQQGVEVVIVERAELPLLPILGPELAQMFATLHRERGVDLRLGAGVDEIVGDEVRISDGSTLRPDLVLVAIGAVPDDGLAAAAGLAVDNGIQVDARLQTSDPNVFAAGDVANHDHPLLGRLRVEHWQNAIDQGNHAAGSMLGQTEPYLAQPYFYTDQYDLGMEYLGHARADDELILRGDLPGRKVTAFCVRDDVVVAGMHTNVWEDMGHIRRLVGHRPATRLRDPAVPLADL